MNIRFMKVEEINSETLQVTFKLNDEEFIVERVISDSDSNGCYPDRCIEAYSEDLMALVDDALELGECDDNINEELYLFIRDIFEKIDCISCNYYGDKNL